MSWNVFYAWQSDSPSNTNRSLIQTALEAAIDQVRADGHLEIDPRLDKDTLGVAGSPDIVATIFEKVANAAVFVADVTIVAPPGSERPSPNPNVLIELGYALKALGTERVVIVMNTAFGGAEQLPFDIRQKRALTYALPADAPEKSPERKRLQKTLVEALRMGLAASEAQRPKAPPAPSAADALLAALEQRLPNQRAATRKYVAELLRAIDAGKPTDPSSDDELVASIVASVPTVLSFWHVAEAFAVYRDAAVKEELLRAFEQIVVRYDVRRGFVGGFNETDFDFFKFVGHELFVLLVAALMREEAWDTLGDVLATTFQITGSSRPDRSVTFERISEYTDLLDRVRRDRIKTKDAMRTSIHADILKERYEAGELAREVTWDVFAEADFFLYLRSRMGDTDAYSPLWRPWSVLYLRHLPYFVSRADSMAYAKRLLTGLGMSDLALTRDKLAAASAYLRRFYNELFWDPPGYGHDWSSFGSRA